MANNNGKVYIRMSKRCVIAAVRGKAMCNMYIKLLLVPEEVV